MSELMQNLPSDKNGFVRELAARQVLLYIGRKGAQDRNINLDIDGAVLKQAIRNADNLWEALFKFHD